MRKRKSRWRLISISGYVIIIFGLLNIIWDFATRGSDPRVFDLGLFVADCAIVFIGLFATAIAESLRDLEERLNQIEGPEKPIENAP
jgi:hypothetical protein